MPTIADMYQRLERVNQMGISMESRKKCIIPVLPERVGIVLGHSHINRKRISKKFKCSIRFHGKWEVAVAEGHEGIQYYYKPYHRIYFKYPVFIIESENETNLWDAINYIQLIVSLPPKKINYLESPVPFRECYCDDDPNGDTFEFCRPCSKLYL